MRYSVKYSKTKDNQTTIHLEMLETGSKNNTYIKSMIMKKNPGYQIEILKTKKTGNAKGSLGGE
jgi:hypothetical protein